MDNDTLAVTVAIILVALAAVCVVAAIALSGQISRGQGD